MERRRDVKTFKEKREREREGGGGMEEERGREEMRRYFNRRD